MLASDREGNMATKKKKSYGEKKSRINTSVKNARLKCRYTRDVRSTISISIGTAF
jgi:hypothetical protein